MADSGHNSGGAVEKIKLVIVDDDLFVRANLSTSLPKHGNFVVTGTFADGDALIAAAQAEAPDVILMDISMPRMGGVEATRGVRKRWRNTKVVALTSFADQFYVDRMRAAGAVGYLFKDTSQPAMARAIEAAHLGIVVSSLQAVPVATFVPPPGLEELNEVEMDILRLVCLGQTNQQIANDVRLAPSTVKHYVSALMNKFGTDNRTALAVRMGPYVDLRTQ